MRGRHNIDHILHGLTEVALVALLVGLADTYDARESSAAVWAMLGIVAFLSITVRSHLRLIRACHLEKLLQPRETPLAPTTSDARGTTGSLEAGRPSSANPASNQPSTPTVAPHSTDPIEELATDADETAAEIVHAATNVPHPLPKQEPQATALASKLDYPSLVSSLLAADDPIAELKRFVGSIRTREADSSDDPTQSPSGLERFAARMLSEAGLFEGDIDLPDVSVVCPSTSHMLYLRTSDRRIPYLARLRIIRLEAALNAVRFASRALPADATEEEAFRVNQALARSITAQAMPINDPIVPQDGADPDGEWAVRYGISEAIETLQLPYRLVAHYRTNVADGNVAIEVELTPADVFPASCFVDGLGIVSSTGDMRQRACADYSLRLALLMAASAFRCSARIRHVWVAGIIENATRRTCYYSVDFDRYRFAKLDLANLGDLSETYRSFAPMMRYEDGWLRPVKQGFHLEEERFCPVRRYLPVSLSSRRLKGRVAESLGTDHVSGLSIEEADGRTLVANAILMRLAPPTDERATQKNVRTVLDLAADDPDPTVRSAAERVVRGLIDGTLDGDAYAVAEEFVRGDALTRANDRAKEQLMRQDFAQVQRTLAPVLSTLDDAGIFDDSSTIVYRYFGSYVERALYNRLYASSDGGRTVMLVPDAYYEAHLLLSIAYLLQGQHEQALRHAQRTTQLAPLDSRSRLHLVKCLESLGRDDEAVEELTHLLEEAHDPLGVGSAYYRMAFFQWKRGQVEAAQACYRSAIQFLPMAAPMVGMELSMLYIQNPGILKADATDEELEQALVTSGIPIAPTERTSEVFYQCAQASLDAEIFPVARNFASVMGAFSGDDVLVGLIRSLEDEPDR